VYSTLPFLRYRTVGGLVGYPSVNSCAWLVRCLAELGAFREGGAYGEEAVRIAEAVNHPISLILAYLGVGFFALRQRDLFRAIPVLERGLELCRVWNSRVWFPEAAATLGWAYACTGRVTEAVPLLEQAEQRGAAMETRGGQSLRVGYVSEAYLRAGRLPEAVQLAGRALALARAQKERGSQAWALRLLGEIAAHQDPLGIEPAAQHYRQALALADELGMRPLVAHCHLGLGTLHSRRGRGEQARPDLAAAVALYQAMEMTFWLPQAEAVLAQVEGR
jgi:tetratricopeptide (TPR) repeat protein